VKACSQCIFNSKVRNNQRFQPDNSCVDWSEIHVTDCAHPCLDFVMAKKYWSQKLSSASEVSLSSDLPQWLPFFEL
jgi:hypothetical protein